MIQRLLFFLLLAFWATRLPAAAVVDSRPKIAHKNDSAELTWDNQGKELPKVSGRTTKPGAEPE